MSHGRTISCELRCDADGWDVLIRDNGEALFSRRCVSEDEARYVALIANRYRWRLAPHLQGSQKRGHRTRCV